MLRAVKSSLVSNFVDGGTESKVYKKMFHFQVAEQCAGRGQPCALG